MLLRPVPATGVAACALAVLIAATPAWAASLTIAVPQGNLPRLIQDEFATPFARAANADVAVVPLGAGQTAADAHADLLLVNGISELVGCKAGVFQKIDWSALGGRDRMLPMAAGDCGVGALTHSLLLSWDRQKFSGTPTWSDFWDVAKVPGKRGLQRTARGNLEFALIADGVAASDVYSTLRSAAGVERAFRKLDQLKPYLVWWQSDDEAPRLLASGEVLMTSAPAEGVLAAARAGSAVAPRDFAVQWTGGLLSIDSFVLLSGAPNPAQAKRFLAFATDPKTRPPLPPGVGPATAGTADALGPAARADSPSASANFGQMLAVDEPFWRDNAAKLEAQFQAWLAKN